MKRARAVLSLPVLSLPVLVWQAVRVRRTMPQLPEALGLDGEVAGSGTTRRIALLGESTAAGVGVGSNEHGLAGNIATNLAAATGTRVEWNVAARTGTTARSATGELLPGLVRRCPALDAVVVVLGVNDLVRGRSLRSWARDVRALLSALREQLGPDSAVVVSGLPPFEQFPSLTRPLRTVLARRAKSLNSVLVRVCDEAGAHFVLLDTELDEPFFCSDRFHPSGRGYAIWAGALTEPLAAPVRAG